MIFSGLMIFPARNMYFNRKVLLAPVPPWPSPPPVPAVLAQAGQAGTGDLLPVFCFPCEVHLEQQKQILCQHHQLKYSLIDPK
jgi:hypothetical protein